MHEVSILLRACRPCVLAQRLKSTVYVGGTSTRCKRGDVSSFQALHATARTSTESHQGYAR